MPDPRFYEPCEPIALSDLAVLAGAVLDGDPAAVRPIAGVAPLERAGPDEVSFLTDRKFLPALAESRAGACFIAPALAPGAAGGAVLLTTPEPQAAYARVAAQLHRPRVHPVDAPILHPDAEIEDGAVLGANVNVGPGARIGRGTVVGPNTVIGPGVAIGRDCRIGANVTIQFALIGDRVRILSGAAIGEAGFGVAASVAGAVDAPQLGRAILQDGVTIGACSCIDRGGWDDTVIGENTKLDNLVQIGHNVRIGRNCVLAAQAGIAGSVVIGDGVQFGGKAGSGDHLVIGDRVRLAAGALTMRDIPAGETWCGVPAKPIRKFMREIAWLARKAEGRGGGGGHE